MAKSAGRKDSDTRRRTRETEPKTVPATAAPAPPLASVPPLINPPLQSDDEKRSALLQWTEELNRLDRDAFEKARAAMSDSLTPAGNHPVADVKFLLATDVSMRLVEGYASLDYTHLGEVTDVIQSVRAYVGDMSLKRPRNYMMLATPGAGKSRLVECVASAVGKKYIVDVSFNMASMESKSDLISVVDAARNIVIDGKIPLVFLDEFDSNPNNYALLLPLLWDGKLELGNNSALKIGRSVFFLAGSSKELPELLDEAKQCRPPRECAPAKGKIVDLLSRISGSVIRIPRYKDLSETDVGDPQRNPGDPNKVVLAIRLLRKRFEECVSVPKCLLRFIALAGFRYGARSIETLINMIQVDPASAASITPTQLQQLPFGDIPALKKSPLAFHLHHDNSLGGLIDLWIECGKLPGMQRIYHSSLGPVSSDNPARESLAALTMYEEFARTT